MKRAIILVIALAVALSCVISGTTAFFTDSVTARGVIKSGNIDVAQIEKMRDGSGLVDYDQRRSLYPAVYDQILQGSYESYIGAVASTKDSEKKTTHTFNVWKSDISGAHDKMVFVENVGSNPFYFRTVFAFAAKDSPAIDDSLKQIDHILLNKNDKDYIWKSHGSALIDGKNYVLLSATYNWNQGANGEVKYENALPGTLPAGKISEPSLIQVLMDKNAQNDYVKYFGEEYEILVVTQAIQTTTMADDYNALEEEVKSTYTCIGDFALYRGFGAVDAEAFKDIRGTNSSISLSLPAETEA